MMRIFKTPFAIWFAGICIACAVTLFLFAFDVKPTGWGGCSPKTEKYGALAVIDGRGFVRPFGRLNFDDGGNWKLVFRRVRRDEEKAVSADKYLMSTIQSIRFECPGGDMGTAEDLLEIMKGDEAVYRTGYYRTQGTLGLQNSEFGYAPVLGADRDLFRLTLDSLPNTLRAK